MGNPFNTVLNLKIMSSFFCDRAIQDEIDVSSDGEEDSEDSSVTENVVRLQVLHDDFKPIMSTSIQELRRAGLKIDCFGLHENTQEATSTTQTCTPNKPLSCLITVLCHDIDAAMKKILCLPWRCLQESAGISVHLQVSLFNEDVSS